ncbi:MAG: GYD domain-containing protein, partial [Pseudomonadota bacterium]|nr:GYD domain-containing protein [Pseudomonadota bacterium]
MLIYISLVNYAESGLRDIKKFLERLAAARKEAEELSGKVDKVYLTMGNRDLITIADLPDDATAATFAFR